MESETLEQRRFTRREYDELVRQGWFEDEPIELLRGLLVKKMTQGTDHNDIVDLMIHVFAQALPIENFGVRAHSGFAATDDSEPEPDFYVYRKPKPSDSHPTSALLLVEVSRSSSISKHAKSRSTPNPMVKRIATSNGSRSMASCDQRSIRPS